MANIRKPITLSKLRPASPFFFFFLNDPAPTEITPLSLHAALPICGRLARKPEARHRRNPHVEGVPRPPAIGGGIGERTDDLQLLDDGTGPSVRDDHRHRILVFRTNMNEMDVQPIDLRDELR